MTDAGKRIAILIPTLGGGGAERVIINLANAFVAKGILTDVVLMRAEGELMSQVDPRVRIICLEADRIRGILLPLASYLRKYRPAVLMACMWPVTIVAFFARVVARVPLRLVFAEHTNWSIAEIANSVWTRIKLNLSMRLLYRFADALVAVSKGAASDLQARAWLPEGSVAAIYNPIVGDITADHQDAAPPAGWVDGPHKRIIAVGTLKPIKDYPTLLRAFKTVSATTPARLLILGEGNERPSLERQILKSKLEDLVFMPGFAIDPASYMACADLHVLSSKGEGFGNVIVEAMAHGVPVVSTDCPSGPREILCDGKYGRLVPPADPEALAAAMLATLAETPDREALKARARDFAVDAIADQYLAVLLPERSSA